MLQSRSHGCSLSHHEMRCPPAAGLGVFEHPLCDGSWGGGDGKDQKDTGCRGCGQGPGGSESAASPFPRRALQRAEGALLLESSPRGEPGAAPAAAAPWRAFLTSQESQGFRASLWLGNFWLGLSFPEAQGPWCGHAHSQGSQDLPGRGAPSWVPPRPGCLVITVARCPGPVQGP